MKNALLYILLSALLLCSCDMFSYHPYDCKIDGPVHLTDKNIERIESQTYGDTLRFAVISDTQRWYDDLNDCVKAINKEKGISFVINCGDLSDFGATDEFIWQRDIMQRLKYPFICLIGNHDMLGTGEETYRHIFGNLNFSFTAGKNLFVCLNTNALEEEHMDDVPDFGFLQSTIYNCPDSIERTFIAVHAQPGSEQFNNDAQYRFHDLIQKFPGIQCCLSGHGHKMEDKALFGDSIRYIMCPNIHKREYLLFTVTKEGFSYEVSRF